MGFGTTRNQLTKLILPRSRKQSDDTSSTTSLDDDDDCSKMDPLPLMSMNRQYASVDRAYNFDIFKEKVEVIKDETTFPLPYIDTTCLVHPFRSSSSPMAKPKASYRWYLGERDEDKSKDTVKDVFQPFFAFGALSNNNDHDDMEGSDSTSLLHGGSRKSVFLKPAPPSSSSYSPIRTFGKRKEMDENAYLMNEISTSNDWSERQLAFDLEVVEDDPSLDDTSLWILQPDEFSFEPPAIRFYEESSLLLPSSPCDAINEVDAKQQQKLYDGLLRDMQGCQRRIKCSSRKSTANRRSSRRSAHRRGSPVLRGSKFSPSLSIITELASEQDTI
jgi:hypothetical protein